MPEYSCPTALSIKLHVTTGGKKKKKKQLDKGNARVLIPYSLFIQSLSYFCHLSISSPPMNPLHEFSAVTKLRDPAEKSNFKIPSIYSQFPLTNIPLMNTDETGSHAPQNVTVSIINTSKEFTVFLHLPLW